MSVLKSDEQVSDEVLVSVLTPVSQAKLISALQQERSATLMQIFLAGSDTKNDGTDRGRGTSRSHDDNDDDDDNNDDDDDEPLPGPGPGPSRPLPAHHVGPHPLNQPVHRRNPL